MKRSFTLLELLIVIAILCIIAAITFPIVMEVKAKSENTTLQLKWKSIQDPRGRGERLYRTKTPKGWLVGAHYDMIMVYIPDPTHEWSLQPKVESE